MISIPNKTVYLLFIFIGSLLANDELVKFKEIYEEYIEENENKDFPETILYILL